MKLKNQRSLRTALQAFIVILSTVATLRAVAESDTAATPAPTAYPKIIHTNAEDGQDLITNNNLRTLAGSDSKWSFASTWNYMGGTVYAPFNEGRPNISGGSATTVKTDIDGNLNIKYNFNTTNSIFLGFGVRWIAPFTPGGPHNFSGTQYDAVNPSVTFQHLYKLGTIQSVLQVNVTEWTQSDQVSDGYGQQFQIDQENIYEIGHSGLSVGASTGVWTNTFIDNNPALLGRQSEFAIWVLPYVEYQLSDKINLRTVFNLWTYEFYRDQTASFDKWTQSIGVGFSVTKNIFLYPNLQFVPEDIRGDRTNVALAATINLF